MEGNAFVQDLQQNVFFSRDETYQGGITGHGAFIACSNKRLYTSYKNWSGKREQSVDLRDVTGVSYAYIRPIAMLIIAFIVLAASLIVCAIDDDFLESVLPIGGILFLILLVVFLLGRRTMLQVEYAGGKINYLVRGSSAAEVRDFIARLRCFKDVQVENRPLG